MYTVELKRKCHLRRRERERPALVDADKWVWVYRSTVQCTVQRVQPDRGHHCGRRRNKRYYSTGLLAVRYQLIYRYYRVDRVHPTGLTVNQGCRQLSTTVFYLEIWCQSEKIQALSDFSMLTREKSPAETYFQNGCFKERRQLWKNTRHLTWEWCPPFQSNGPNNIRNLPSPYVFTPCNDLVFYTGPVLDGPWLDQIGVAGEFGGPGAPGAAGTVRLLHRPAILHSPGNSSLRNSCTVREILLSETPAQSGKFFSQKLLHSPGNFRLRSFLYILGNFCLRKSCRVREVVLEAPPQPGKLLYQKLLHGPRNFHLRNSCPASTPAQPGKLLQKLLYRPGNSRLGNPCTAWESLINSWTGHLTFVS